MRYLLLALLSACQGTPRDPVASRDDVHPTAVLRRDRIPDAALVTHTGETVRFRSDLAGNRCVLVQFFYIDCEKICPPVSRRLHDLHGLLSVEERKRVRFLSITLDPDEDTPQALAAYVQRMNFPADWIYLTGQPAEIESLRQALGERLAQGSVSDTSISHAAAIIVGNEALGDWQVLPSTLSPERMRTILQRFLR